MGGATGTVPITAEAQVLVGPSTSTEKNLVTAGLIPVGCWRVDDIRFDFDSSFLLPDLAPEIQAFASLRDEHKKPVSPRTTPDMPKFIFPPLTIFGHADPVGNDDYNKLLSGRRAAAIYGLLTRRIDIWEDLFNNGGKFASPVPGDKWGDKALQTMQQTTGLQAGTARPTLFRAYMDTLCLLPGPDGKPVVDADGQSAQLKLDPTDDFLARGQDPHGQGDYQGCGEFNPLLLFSQQDSDDFDAAKDKTARNFANAPNRRVMVLLFRPGSSVNPDKWPCPRTKEGTAGCIKRFWSDGQSRRQRRLPDETRKFIKSQDTFACRFYQRLTNSSPCESAGFWVVRVLEDASTPLSERKPLANLPFSVTGVDGGSKEIRGTTDDRGILRIPVLADPVTMTLSIAGLQVVLAGGSLKKINAGVDGVLQRLSNLGFVDLPSGKDTTAADSSQDQLLADALTLFQKTNDLPVTNGEVDSQTRESLKSFHGC